MYKDFEPLLKDLPEGWKASAHFGDNVVVLSQGQGFVSIHTEARCFDLGYGVPRIARAKGSGYTGRGWKQKILKDAMAALVSAELRIK